MADTTRPDTERWLMANTSRDENGHVIYNGKNTGKTVQEILGEQGRAFDKEWDEAFGPNPMPPGQRPWERELTEDAGGAFTPEPHPSRASAPSSGPSSAPSGAAASPAGFGEITGLQSAIAYAQGSAESAERAAAQDEAAIAALQAGGTSSPALTSLQSSIEQHHTNARHYRAAAEELNRQLQVREAYNANPGAGTKQFVTSE